MPVGFRGPQKDRFRQVYLARDRLHGVVRKSFRIEDDGKRIAGKSPIGENIVDSIMSCHGSPPLQDSVAPCPTERAEARRQANCVRLRKTSPGSAASRDYSYEPRGPQTG